MARRKSTSRSGKSKRARKAPQGWMEESMRALWPPLRRALPWVLAGAALAALLIFGANRIRQRVAGRDRFVIESDSLVLKEVQQVGDLRWSVRVRPVGLEAPLNALDRGVAGKLADAFTRDPWVERVRSLKIRYPNRVRVGLTLRRPVAAIRVRSDFYWVDRDSVRLPGTLSVRDLGDAGLLFIDGVTGPIPPTGQPWDHPGVRAGVETAMALSKDAATLGLTAIDVGNVGGRRDPEKSEIVLLDRQNTRILWGRPPSTEWRFEILPEQKIRNLHEAAASGYLNGPGDVDVRLPDRIIKYSATER